MQHSLKYKVPCVSQLLDEEETGASANNLENK